jgi:hypothetical protein
MVDTGGVTRRARPLRPALAALAALAVAVLGAACTSTGYHYVKNSDDRTYFKVPDGWKLFGEDAVMKVFGKGLSPRERRTERDTTWQVVFDASPKPSIDHLGDPKAKHPNGIAVVRELSFDDADTMSISSLRNLFYDVDSAIQNDTGEVLTYEPLEPDGGFHGFHLVANVDADKGRVVTLDQTTLVDQATSKVYSLLVTCDADCYDHNSEQIGHVVDSWTVKS